MVKVKKYGKPKPPQPPIKPEPIITSEVCFSFDEVVLNSSDGASATIEDIIKFAKSKQPKGCHTDLEMLTNKDIKMRMHRSWDYGELEVYFEVRIDNPRYKSEMNAYNRAKAKYEKEAAAYEQKLMDWVEKRHEQEKEAIQLEISRFKKEQGVFE